MSSSVSGLALHIRNSTESDTFDLAGQNVTTVTTNIEQAFREPFDLLHGNQEMIRLTFITGAGKLGRSKYDDNCAKHVTAALRSVGYEEDRTASCVIECAGSFKLQHDTGKNLKTVVVFPKIIGGGGDGDGETAAAASSSSVLPTNSLEYKIAVSSMVLFENMVKHKLISWSQKRSCLVLMEEQILVPLDRIDAVLMKGHPPLSSEEQKFYDTCIEISDKRSHLKDAMQLHVLDGKLTQTECEYLLDQVTSKIQECNSGGGGTVPKGFKERQSKLQSILKNPIAPLPLKNITQLSKLWKKASPLLYLNNTGGKLLSSSDTKKLGQLNDILDDIATLEASSRGLLEDDDTYRERITNYRRELQNKYGNSTGATRGGGRSKKATSSGMMMPSSSKASGANGGTAWKVYTPSVGGKGGAWGGAKKKKGGTLKNRGGDLFSAMMADDDDDDSDDSSDEEDKVVVTNTRRENVNTVSTTTTASAPVSSSSTTTTSGGTSTTGNNNTSNKNKKKNKKKNKNSKGGGNNNNYDDDAFLNAAVAANKKAAKKIRKHEENEVENDNDGVDGKIKLLSSEAGTATTATTSNNVFLIVFSLITEYLIPIIVAVLTWLVTMVFGKSKKNNNKGKRKKKN